MTNRSELETLMADYLDGLLEPEEARDAEARIAAEPQLFADVARLRAALYRPYAVPPPADGLERRILTLHRDRPWTRLVRYAAVFLAGALTALLFRFSPEPHPTPDAPPETSAPEVDAVFNRRIR